MESITKMSEFNKLKKSNFSVLLMWAEGCPACAAAKPEFEQLAEKFSQFNFYNAPLTNQSMEFFKYYDKENGKRVPLMNKDGSPVLDKSGKPVMTVQFDHSVSIPKYYVTHGDNITAENSYGLVGTVDGYNTPQLEAILNQISELKNE